jgi:hypothetical protein
VREGDERKRRWEHAEKGGGYLGKADSSPCFDGGPLRVLGDVVDGGVFESWSLSVVKARCATRRYFFWLVTGPVSVAQALVKVPTLAPGPLRINHFATSPLNTRPQAEKNTTLARERPIHWGIHHLRIFVQLAISVSPRSSSTHQTSSLAIISCIFHLTSLLPALCRPSSCCPATSSLRSAGGCLQIPCFPLNVSSFSVPIEYCI